MRMFINLLLWSLVITKLSNSCVQAVTQEETDNEITGSGEDVEGFNVNGSDCIPGNCLCDEEKPFCTNDDQTDGNRPSMKEKLCNYLVIAISTSICFGAVWYLVENYVIYSVFSMYLFYICLEALLITIPRIRLLGLSVRWTIIGIVSFILLAELYKIFGYLHMVFIQNTEPAEFKNPETLLLKTGLAIFFSCSFLVIYYMNLDAMHPNEQRRRRQRQPVPVEEVPEEEVPVEELPVEGVPVEEVPEDEAYHIPDELMYDNPEVESRSP